MISVILSTNNEIRNNYLKDLLDSLKNQNTKYEIIVVDNWSTDKTLEICKKYTTKIYNLDNSNRAQRFNLGFKKSIWDIVLFHHPVCILPKNSFLNIEKSLSWNNIRWWYTHSFDNDSFLLKFTSWYSWNIRWKRWILYVDHCIFAKSNIVAKTNIFWEVDIFEDSVFSKNMLKYSKPVIIKDRLVTSARRFKKRWIIKQILINMLMKQMYYLNINHKYMNKLYEKKDGFNVKY